MVGNVPQETIIGEEVVIFFDDSDLDTVFREELESSGYGVVGNPDALFEDPITGNLIISLLRWFGT